MIHCVGCNHSLWGIPLGSVLIEIFFLQCPQQVSQLPHILLALHARGYN